MDYTKLGDAGLEEPYVPHPIVGHLLWLAVLAFDMFTNGRGLLPLIEPQNAIPWVSMKAGQSHGAIIAGRDSRRGKRRRLLEHLYQQGG